MTIKVRFAPSPTGKLHLGGLRTALMNLYFARKHNGRIIFRLENTDLKRQIPHAGEEMFSLLEDRFHFQFDEGPFGGIAGSNGPYIQSERIKLYREFAQQLVNDKAAYPCFCSPERLASIKSTVAGMGVTSRYDGHCKLISQSQREELKRTGAPFVIRLDTCSMPGFFQDKVFGRIGCETAATQENDFILLKSDGYPTYHLANVVDDHLMEISHVIRGAEWIASTTGHLLLYKAFGWTVSALSVA